MLFFGIVDFPAMPFFMRNPMEYMTLKEAADKWGIGDRRINALCLQGRIEGAVRFGNAWAIPVDAEKPSDARIKTGKYIKEKD